MIRYDENVSQRYGIKLLDDNIILKEAKLGTKESWECFLTIIQHFMSNQDPTVVPVYTFEVLSAPKDPEARWGVEYTYRYTMKRLAMLDESEKQLIEDMYDASIYPGRPERYKERLDKNSKEHPELVKFMSTVLSLGRYRDVHRGNFLKDEDGSYKIIDLEGFIFTPLGRTENNWLKR
jgi:hypothetical protein